MKLIISIITTIEQKFETTNEGLVLTSQKILKSEIIQEEGITKPKTIVFSETDVRYGIISIRKSHELGALYSPNTKIKLVIDGVEGVGNWHKTACRISGLTALMRLAKAEANKEYIYNYDVDNKILKLEKYEED